MEQFTFKFTAEAQKVFTTPPNSDSAAPLPLMPFPVITQQPSSLISSNVNIEQEILEGSRVDSKYFFEG